MDHSSAACLSSITTCFLKNEEIKNTIQAKRNK